MGSKRAMLTNGLGQILSEVVSRKKAFFDLFCGAGSVSAFVSQNLDVPVTAGDLQEYAVALTRAHVEQERPFSPEPVLYDWGQQATVELGGDESLWREACLLSSLDRHHVFKTRKKILDARFFCNSLPERFSFSRAYGGYYYSPEQAITIDALRAALPKKKGITALAALIRASSSCAASPGHTAQPFSTTDTALPYLVESWRRSVGARVQSEFKRLSQQFAKRRGSARRLNAAQLAESLTEQDIAFIDPPYSEVQYSRFYHVLETVATARDGDVVGTGRYPPISERPQSNYCKKSCSLEELQNLMLSVAAAGAEAIVTFPAGSASNGLSGEMVEAVSAQFFYVRKRKVSSSFSTMGGNKVIRNARHSATELILHLAPR